MKSKLPEFIPAPTREKAVKDFLELWRAFVASPVVDTALIELANDSFYEQANQLSEEFVEFLSQKDSPLLVDVLALANALLCVYVTLVLISCESDDPYRAFVTAWFKRREKEASGE